MDKNTERTEEIEVTREVKLVYNQADGWFTVFDQLEFDALGAVTMGMDDSTG